MELYIRLQVQTIAAALALGAAAVLVYELLRTVRLDAAAASIRNDEAAAGVCDALRRQPRFLYR